MLFLLCCYAKWQHAGRMPCFCVVNAGHPPRVKSSVIPVILLLVYNQKPTGLHRLDKVFYFGFLTVWSSQKVPGDATASMGRNHQGLACCCMANLLGSPTRDKCTVIPVMLLWMYNPKPPCTRNFQIYTDWTSFLLCSIPTTVRSQKVTGHATA